MISAHAHLMQSIHDLNELVLENVLMQLPQLTGLHVINCSKMDHNVVLRLTSFTPDLRSLSFTSWASIARLCFLILHTDRPLGLPALHGPEFCTEWHRRASPPPPPPDH